MSTAGLAEHFFRHEYGRLVASLSARAGAQHIEAIEDAVQSALMSALDTWTIEGQPDNPSAWLFRVAHNKLIGELRQQLTRHRILARYPEGLINPAEDDQEYFPSQSVQDDLLRMLFVCCDDAIPVESQIALALKTLCGFGVQEIALRLFTSADNIYKRLARARSKLRSGRTAFVDIEAEQYASRLPAVTKVLYLMFTEGYLSGHSDFATRRELCGEAIRLATILVEHTVGQVPEVFALLALMYLHSARMTSRQNDSGGLLLLEEQDRSQWDKDSMQRGLMWLGQSAQGDGFSRYHAEAGIAAEHCLAPSFAETRWEKVVECYEILERVAPSPIHKLNRAVAVAEWRGPDEGLAILAEFEPPGWLSASYMWTAVLADLHRRCGHHAAADRYTTDAFAQVPTPAIKQLLERRLGTASLNS